MRWCYPWKHTLIFIDSANEHNQALYLEDDTETIQAMQWNQTGDKLCILSDKKRLNVYHLDQSNGKTELSLFQSCFVPRNATSMSVTLCEQTCSGTQINLEIVVVGDKTGEILAFNLNDLSRAPKSLGGHTTSTISCLAMSRDHRYLVSGDRDEKIRISSFPQTNLIENYCLGHTASIVDAQAVCMEAWDKENTPSMLLSCSKDNTICLWELDSGRLMDQCAVADPVSQILMCPSINSAIVVASSYLSFLRVTSDFKIDIYDQFNFLPGSQPMESASQVARVEWDNDTKSFCVQWTSSPYLQIYHVKESNKVNSAPLEFTELQAGEHTWYSQIASHCNKV